MALWLVYQSPLRTWSYSTSSSITSTNQRVMEVLRGGTVPRWTPSATPSLLPPRRTTTSFADRVSLNYQAYTIVKLSLAPLSNSTRAAYSLTGPPNDTVMPHFSMVSRILFFNDQIINDCTEMTALLIHSPQALLTFHATALSHQILFHSKTKILRHKIK